MHESFGYQVLHEHFIVLHFGVEPENLVAVLALMPV
jgi:hypothetical protein